MRLLLTLLTGISNKIILFFVYFSAELQYMCTHFGAADAAA